MKTGKVQPFARSVRNSGDESAKKSEKHRLLKKTGMGIFKKRGVFWRALDISELGAMGVSNKSGAFVKSAQHGASPRAFVATGALSAGPVAIAPPAGALATASDTVAAWIEP